MRCMNNEVSWILLNYIKESNSEVCNSGGLGLREVWVEWGVRFEVVEEI